MLKRIISLILVVCTMVTLCAINVSALYYTYFPMEGHYPDYALSKNAWYYSGAGYLKIKYLFLCFDQNFISDQTFRPNKAVLRKEVAAFIYGYNGNYFSDGNSYGVSETYKDVQQGRYSYFADWCYEQGIMNGWCKGYFSPNVSLTREEFMTVLYRYTLFKGISTEASSDTAAAFSDYGKVSSWARDAIDWGCETGLMNGKTKTTLNPRDCITRAELAMIAYRYDSLILAHNDNCEHLGYTEVLGPYS